MVDDECAPPREAELASFDDATMRLLCCCCVSCVRTGREFCLAGGVCLGPTSLNCEYNFIEEFGGDFEF